MGLIHRNTYKDLTNTYKKNRFIKSCSFRDGTTKPKEQFVFQPERLVSEPF